MHGNEANSSATTKELDFAIDVFFGQKIDVTRPVGVWIPFDL